MGSLRGKRELLPISIHALFAEGDLCLWRSSASCPISIHALFAEGDAWVY